MHEIKLLLQEVLQNTELKTVQTLPQIEKIEPVEEIEEVEEIDTGYQRKLSCKKRTAHAGVW